MNISQAILKLRPGSLFYCVGETYDGLHWSDENDLPPPTEEEVQAEIQRLQQEWEYNQYQRNRASEYPSIQDQLDTLYHQGYEGWKASIDEVKSKYPNQEKPDEYYKSCQYSKFILSRY